MVSGIKMGQETTYVAARFEVGWWTHRECAGFTTEPIKCQAGETLPRVFG